ncbi:phosphoadenylyl-sulfate reductase [Aneurinibacillus sp. Ricciae_BoGa-3]|uniref:phosphoadenylyl-sulfate reductase n=1 Tax=Aneurinibacillus sp. Ricciae_BoGa-3 TaxID=3022697 RepID=UPI0023421783|nr:phosphoadenylyl-sulfate reductase [Aneurinibacillus sp. Ricciae_BoGa-3]WCK55335.1 phosphoadenylyl-sulfate reductase [Aneurinibacillus sp. Ricciae_BoGa-3]
MAQLSYQDLAVEDFARINEELAGKDTLDVLKWAYGQFGDELVYACSFGAEGIVLIDLISKVKKDAKIVFLDTNVHFKETYELIDRVKQKYPSLRIEMNQPAITLEQQAKQYGEKLWETDPNSCCNIRKVQPLTRALSGAAAWLSGLRREQSPTRAATEFVNQDNKFKSIKICPLIHWTWDDVWNYIRAFDLPYNTLHDKGYPSIGCEYCTSPVEDAGDSRAGRWAGKGKTECGLHL